MTDPAFAARIAAELQGLRDAGAYKGEQVITGKQGARIRLADGRELINLCSNNYLGLASDARLLDAAAAALRSHGLGLASVRFICGTQDLHKQLEARIAAFVGTEDAVLYAAAFDANGGLFEPLLDEADAVISDELNHASIIDGIRLCKARRWRYRHDDMDDLRRCLQEARAGGARTVLVFTDGVFSMDGRIAQLAEMRRLCDEHGALLGVDDCHATGVIGPHGRGTAAHCGVFGRVDLVTGTFGKALGGASGGFTACSRPVAELLRQRSRPYLFSNTLAPPLVGAALAALDLLERSDAAVRRVQAHAARFRAALQAQGHTLIGSGHPIVPVLLGDEHAAKALAQQLHRAGVHAVAFSYPVVPRGRARIRTQLSAAHTDADLDEAVAAFAAAG
jgi:glycine C-acetyltransferase